MSPRHVNPTKDDRRATAPYNFVPLPRCVMAAPSPGWLDEHGKEIDLTRSHDRFVDGARTGWVDLTLRTSTPLFTRGPVVQGVNGKWTVGEPRLRSDPFTTRDGRPMIPGSSLRGMIRTLVEILSFSKVAPVTTERPFFRSVSDDVIGKRYASLVPKGLGYGAGFARREGDDWVIEAVDHLRVARSLLGSNPDSSRGKRCRIRPGAGGPFSRIEVRSDLWIQGDEDEDETWPAGTIVVTGDVPGTKEREFIFLGPTGERHPIEQTLLDRFNEDEQVTKWQRERFTGLGRGRPGHLGDGDPVFFVLSGARSLEFFGRAGMFRFPYDLSPAALANRPAEPTRDLAEAVFGVLNANGTSAIKGRVRFEDMIGQVEPAPVAAWRDREIVNQLLSPHPQSFQHYLAQPSPDRRDELKTYVEKHRSETETRGHKLYWHRTSPNGLDEINKPKTPANLATKLKPVRGGVTFDGRVRFENLSDVELGALLTALQLPHGHEHKLGMGRPLGLGSVRIEATLHLVRPETWYGSWDEGLAGPASTDQTPYTKVFCEAVLDHAAGSREPVVADFPKELRHLARLAEFYAMLDRANAPAWAQTAHMGLTGQPNFKTRPVLPTPFDVLGRTMPVVVPSPSREPSRRDHGRGGAAKAPARAPRGAPAPTTPGSVLSEGDQVRAKPIRRQRSGDWDVVLPDHDGMKAKLRDAPGNVDPNAVLDGMIVFKAGHSPILVYPTSS